MDTDQKEPLAPLSQHLESVLAVLLYYILDDKDNSYAKLSFVVSTQCSVIANSGIAVGSYEELCSYKSDINHSYRNACICGNLSEKSIEPKLSYHCPVCAGKYYKPLIATIPQGMQDLLPLFQFHLRMNLAPAHTRFLEIDISQLEFILIKILNRSK